MYQVYCVYRRGMAPPRCTKNIVYFLQVYGAAEMYQVSKRHVAHNVTSFVDFFVNFPNRFWSKQIIINATRPRAIFYNVSLQGLDIPLQAYTMHINCIQCNDSVATGDSSLCSF